MDIVSFETAKRLRDAGFPQPETVELGQFWYSAGELWLIQAPFRTGIHPFKWFASYPAYAPELTEMLKELPTHNLVFRHDKKEWACVPTTDTATISNATSASEAVAAAWLLAFEA